MMTFAYRFVAVGQMTLLGRAGISPRPPDIHTNTTKIRFVILPQLHARRKLYVLIDCTLE